MAVGIDLAELGKVAGIAGVAVGALTIVFSGVIRQKVFSQLPPRESFILLIIIVVLVWTVAIGALWIGGGSKLIDRTGSAKPPAAALAPKSTETGDRVAPTGLLEDDPGDAIRRFWKPDGSTINKENEKKLKDWLAANADGEPITFFMSGANPEAKAALVQTLNTDLSDAIRRFWKPDGSTINKENEKKLKDWLAANADGVPISFFIATANTEAKTEIANALSIKW